jgi:hypothetical protein
MDTPAVTDRLTAKSIFPGRYIPTLPEVSPAARRPARFAARPSTYR